MNRLTYKSSRANNAIGRVRSRVQKATLLAAASIMALGGSSLTWSDDTEVFLSQFAAGGGGTGRPKVLIIFDTSGSMGNNVTFREDYNPNTDYGNTPSDRIYWSTNGRPPRTSVYNSSEDEQYVFSSYNACASSYDALNELGYFTGKVMRYDGDYDDRWEAFGTSSGYRNDVFDCEADAIADPPIISNGGATRSGGDGYPTDDNSDKPYTNDVDKIKTNWSNTVTLYTANYVNWYYSNDPDVVTTRPKIDVAKDVLQDTIESTPGVDFGLMAFNYNDTSTTSGAWYQRTQRRNGGRVISGIPDGMTDTQKDDLLDTIEDMNDGGWTPLCETYYEAYRYIAGLGVWYGDDDPNRTPARDTSVEDGGTYEQPLEDCQYLYVVYMTDGKPTYDTMANSLIENLTGQTCDEYATDHGDDYYKNCFPVLAEYMYNNDLDGDTSNGEQKVITYTIGFTTNQELLAEAAEKGGGEYFVADNAEQLADAFRGALTGILQTNTSFTAPAVAVDSYQRTFNRDEVFLAMFKPEATPKWPGNIKKLELDGDIFVGANPAGQDAIDGATGRIKDTVRTFWTPAADGADGDEVTAGGAGGLLAARDPATRVIKTNTGTSGALEDFNVTNLTYDAFGLTGEADLHSLFGVADAAEFAELVSWVRGFDVDEEDEDGSTTDARWILADMLHSRPIAVNYGSNTNDPNAQVIKLVVGTNGGFVHMFDGATGVEDWAFTPKELAPIHNVLRTDSAQETHPYGMDNTAALLLKDVDNDGVIEPADGDSVWIYLTMRRGGNKIYALNITNASSPVFGWMIDESTTVSGGGTPFAELGQTWSIPQTGYIPGYTNPVLIFGAGYDPANDTDGVAAADSMGRGIYIVDAYSGALVWSVTNSTNSAMQHSIPAPVTPFDSNGDLRYDRVYAPDTGGNVWRVDLTVNGTCTDASCLQSVVSKIATLNEGAAASDRRFFNRIDLARAKSPQAGGFDALILGSGNRASPLETTVVNRMYMIRDRKLNPVLPTDVDGVGTDAIPGTCATGDGAPPTHWPYCQSPITNSDLYDATANLVQDGSDTAARAAAVAALYDKAGWRINLEGVGEKSLAAAVTIDGVVWFTTFEPLDPSASVCEPRGGVGWLYAVNLLDAKAEFDFTNDSTLSKPDRKVELFIPTIPDTPAVHFGEDNNIRLLFPSGGGPKPAELGNPLTSGATRITPTGITWYSHEAE